jgi:hypothetical protein
MPMSKKAARSLVGHLRTHSKGHTPRGVEVINSKYGETYRLVVPTDSPKPRKEHD